MIEFYSKVRKKSTTANVAERLRFSFEDQEKHYIFIVPK